MSKRVNFEWQRWMTLAAIAVIFFTLSYLMAATVPVCSDCGHDLSAMQFFHYVCIVAFICGSIGCTIGAFVTWSEDWNDQ